MNTDHPSRPDGHRSRASGELEARLAAIIESSEDAIIGKTLDGEITSWNRAAQEIYGYSTDEAVGQHISILVPPDRADDVPLILDRVRRGDKVTHYETVRKRKDGTLIDVSVSVSPVRNESGVIVGASTIARDITEQKRLAKRLAEAEELYRTIFESAVAGIFRATADGRILAVNSAFAAIFGYESIEQIMAELEDTRALWADPDQRTRLLERLDHEEQVSGFVADCLRRDGSPVSVSLEIQASRDPDGRLTGMIGTAVDVTDQIAAESHIRRAQEEAERANQAKSEFLSRMSHELRTPLSVILGFAELLMLGLGPDKQKESIDQILKAGRHLLDLINEVLDLARIESGKMAISREPVDAVDSISEAVGLIRPLADAETVALHTDLPAEDVHVPADRQRLKQVLLNLLSNAVKYNREFGEVVVSCEPSEERVVIKVADTGPGIPDEKIDRLFVPFDRLDADRTDTSGSGLGLTLTKNLVDLMGGNLTVESRIGVGSTFAIEFGRVESPVHVAHRQGRGPRSPSRPSAGKRRAVLCIEDNLSVQKLLQHFVAERPSIEYIMATRGSTGLDLARQHRPDLILLDLHLPDFDGEEVLRKLKDDDHTKGVPVVVVSADATRGQAERLMAAGAADFLTKPLELEAFLEVLDSILEKRS